MARRQDDRAAVRHLSRRQALRLLGGAGGTALLAACGGTATPTTGAGGTGASTAPATTNAGGATAPPTTGGATATTKIAAPPTRVPLGGTAAAGGTPASTAASGPVGAITIPQSAVPLPTDKVSFRWIDSGDLKALFYKKYFAAYQQAHPNITIQYDPLPWSEIQKVVPLGVQNGNAHDVFQLPLNVPAGQAVSEGWVAPLDDIIPNFAKWKTRFPFGAFIEGVHVFNGKIYTFPLTSSKRYGTLLLYNTAYLQQAGYDPASKPFTWDDFRTAAKKLTAQGKGQYYGFIFGGKDSTEFSAKVSNLARMAGASAGGNDVNWKTGQYNYTADQYLAAIDLLLALKADGSVFPGVLSLNGPDVRSRMPQGVSAMILDGPWNIPQWPREKADFAFGVASQPVPNSGQPLPLTYEETGANQVWAYAKSPNKAIIADMFSYVASDEGQTAIVVASEGNLRSFFPQAQAQAEQSQELDPHARQAIALFEQQVRVGPMPEVRNPEQSQVDLELKHIHPDFGEVVQGLYTGQLKDPKAAMQDLQDRMDKDLDRAIKAAQAKGAKVSRDDWKFPNWDPMKDYTDADYQALKS